MNELIILLFIALFILMREGGGHHDYNQSMQYGSEFNWDMMHSSTQKFDVPTHVEEALDNWDGGELPEEVLEWEKNNL